MPLTPEAQLYFWCRHSEGTAPERALEKWRRDLRNPRLDPKEIEEFLVDMVNRVESGDRGYRAMHEIQTGTAADNPVLTVTEGHPPTAPLPKKAKKRLFAKKEK